MVKRARKSKVRRTHRKGTRRATRKMRGGYLELSPSGVTNTGMDAPYKLNMLQGQEYASQHANQHGGYQNNSMNTSSMNMPSMNSSSMNMPSMNSSSMNSPSMNSSTMNSSTMNSPSMNMPYTNSSPIKFPYTNTQSNMPNQMGGVAPVGDSGVLDSNLRESARLGPLDQSFQEIAGMTDQAGGRRRRRKGRKSRKSRKGSKSRRSRRKMRGGSSGLMAASTNANTMLLDGKSSSHAVTEMNPEWKLAENPNSFAPQK